MYNSFPNYGYVFFLKNERNEIVTFGKNFSKSKNAGYVGHTFYSICEHHGFSYGSGKEKPEDMKVAGEELMNMIVKDEDIEHLGFDSLKLYRRYYYLDKRTLEYRDDVIYAQSIKR
jgi:hypothetical protein